MGWLERTDYPFFPAAPPPVLVAAFTPSADEVAFVQTLTRPHNRRLSVALMLKCFQALGYFPSFDEIPVVCVDRVRAALTLEPEVRPGYREAATLSRHRKAVRRLLRARICRESGRRKLREAMQAAARKSGDINVLINTGVRALRQERIELPAFSRFTIEARAVLAQRNKRAQRLGLSQQDVDALLTKADGRGRRIDGREIALEALSEIESQLRQLTAIQKRLTRLLRGGGPLSTQSLHAALLWDDGPKQPDA